MKEPENHIESIITRKISSEISVDEEQILNDWLKSRTENLEYFQDMQKIYDQAEVEDNREVATINIDQEWHTFRTSVIPQRVNTSFRTSWTRIAASIMVISILSYIIWSTVFKAESITVLATTSGQTVILPDNSEVTLNVGAMLTYPQKFIGKKRLIALTGEAFFEVVRNERKPFIVNLNQGEVEVLGTSFNVMAIETNDKIEVVVETGKVKLSATANKDYVILTKGEIGTIMKNNNLVAKANNGDANFMAWKTRKIVFDDIGLDEVILTLNRLYDAKISFLTEVGKNCKVSVSFDNQSLEAILSVLELTLDLEYKKTGDLIEVVRSGC